MQKPKCSTSTAATKAKQTGASVSLSLWFFSFEFLALELISRTPRRLQRSRSPCFLAAFQGRKEQQTTTTTRWKGRGGGERGLRTRLTQFRCNDNKGIRVRVLLLFFVFFASIQDCLCSHTTVCPVSNRGATHQKHTCSAAIG